MNEIEDIVKMLTIYRLKPALFVRNVLGVEPTRQQELLLDAVAEEGAKISVKSGHGVGKTAFVSWIVLWFLGTHDDCRVPCTAPSAHQLHDVLWSEIAKWHERMPVWWKRQYRIMKEQVVIVGAEKTRFAVARTARRENPEALQGFHAKNVLYLLDEASGIDDKIFEVAEGALTSKNSRVIMLSNPTKLEGFFYRSQTDDRANWKCFTFSCLDSPLVSAEYIEKMKKRYGEDSAIYKVRVLGEFPDRESNTLIKLSSIEEAEDRDVVSVSVAGLQPGTIAGLDVARFGDDWNAIVIRDGCKIVYIDRWRGLDLMQTTGRVAELYFDKKAFRKVNVDSIGLGSGVADRLRELGVPTCDVNVAECASGREKFNRLRDELWWKVKEFFEMKFASYPSNLPYKDEMIGELSCIRYGFTSAGRIKVEGKAEMKQRGLESPNIADALCLTFAEGVNPLVNSMGRYGQVAREVKNVSLNSWF